MTNEIENLFSKELVYKINEMKNVEIKQNILYANTTHNELTMDIYYPQNANHHELKPLIIFITGYPDPGFQAMTGYKLKEVAQYISWAKLIAASGFVAITYSSNDPEKDIYTLLKYIKNNGKSLGINIKKIGIWACSGNTPNAVSLLMNNQDLPIKNAVLCYGYMPDVGESKITAEVAKQFKFVNPIPSLSKENLVLNTPLLIVRCGRDEMPGINFSIDTFIIAALASNLPLSLINLTNAPHAFDIIANQEYSYNAIKGILSFIKYHLGT